MFRKVLVLTALILGLLALEVQAAVINSTWDGGGDGRSWEDLYNWDPDIVPDNTITDTFVVTIDSNRIGIDEIEVGLQQPRTIDQLDCYGEVELQDWSPYWNELIFEEPNGLTNHGGLGIEGRNEFEINGNITNTNGAELYLLNLEINGNLYNHIEAIIEVEHEVFVIDANLENSGTIVSFPASQLWLDKTLHNTGQINLYGGLCGGDKTFDNDSIGLVKGFGEIYSDELFHNKGIIYAFGGALVAIITEGPFLNNGVLGNKPNASLHIKPNLFELPPDVNNQGTIEVNAGGGVTFDCNLNNEPNAVIKLLGGTLAATTITQSDDATFKGQGNITTNNLVIESDGSIQLTGPTKIFGNVQIDPNATLEISDGTTLITGQTVCNGTIHIKGGYLIPQGGLSGDCNIIWEPGTYTNPADFNLDGKVNFGDFAYFAETWLWQTELH